MCIRDRSVNVPWFADHDEMLRSVKPRGVVIATPNATHAKLSLIHISEPTRPY